MCETLAEVSRVLGLQADPRRRIDYDWTGIESRLGARLPSDYKAISEGLPGLEVAGFLQLIPPVVDEVGLYDVVSASAVFKDWLDDMLDDSDWEDMISYMPFDGERGLLVWGITSNGDDCCWNVQSDDPDDWTVVICGGKGAEWSAFDGGIAAFLVALFEDRASVDAFPEAWPGPNTVGR